MGRPRIDLTENIYDRLKVIKFLYVKNGNSYFNCECECGNECIVRGSDLKRGVTKSCGCLRIDHGLTMCTNNKLALTHGEGRTSLYNRWDNMKQRCYNLNNPRFEDYGGRGIAICEEWFNYYENFAEWSYTNGYQEYLSLDRINNDGNYEPSNCRWTTSKIQRANQRKKKGT